MLLTNFLFKGGTLFSGEQVVKKFWLSGYFVYVLVVKEKKVCQKWSAVGPHWYA